MPELLHVDFSALRGLMAAIERTIEDVESTLDDLDGQVTKLSQVWEGAASDGFHRIMAEWTTNTTDLRGQLAYLHRLVRTAHDNHASASRANTTIWQG